MKVVAIEIVIGALETIPKDLKRGLEELEIEERIETIQTIAFFRSTRIIGKDMET